MPKFSRDSKSKLAGCHPDLQLVCNAAIEKVDFKIIYGRRSSRVQKKLFNDGRSKTKQSKHLAKPSLAVDLAPFPIDWDDHQRFYLLGGWIMYIAGLHGIALRWGGNWDGDGNLKDQNFYDLGHFELLTG